MTQWHNGQSEPVLSQLCFKMPWNSHSTLDRAFSPIENETRINNFPETKQRGTMTSRASLSVKRTKTDLEPKKN